MALAKNWQSTTLKSDNLTKCSQLALILSICGDGTSVSKLQPSTFQANFLELLRETDQYVTQCGL